jgi:hypothetical protein
MYSLAFAPSSLNAYLVMLMTFGWRRAASDSWQRSVTISASSCAALVRSSAVESTLPEPSFILTEPSFILTGGPKNVNMCS